MAAQTGIWAVIERSTTDAAEKSCFVFLGTIHPTLNSAVDSTRPWRRPAIIASASMSLSPSAPAYVLANSTTRASARTAPFTESSHHALIYGTTHEPHYDRSPHRFVTAIPRTSRPLSAQRITTLMYHSHRHVGERTHAPACKDHCGTREMMLGSCPAFRPTLGRHKRQCNPAL